MWWLGGNTCLLFGETSTDMLVDLIPFNQTCLLVHWKSDKGYSTDASTSDMPTNTVKLYQARLLLHSRCNVHPCWSSATPCRELLSCCSCNIYACWPSVFTATSTATGWVLLQDGCMLDHCHSIMPADLLPLNHACLLVLCFSSYLPYMLVWCLTISPAGLCGVSLVAISSSVVPHYRSYLLVLCLTISHACRCGASL